MEIIQIIYLKIKLSTTILPLGHFTDPHPLYCRWFAERRVSLNKNPHYLLPIIEGGEGAALAKATGERDGTSFTVSCNNGAKTIWFPNQGTPMLYPLVSTLIKNTRLYRNGNKSEKLYFTV